MTRLRDEAGVVAVEFALIMAAMTPVIVVGSDLLVKLLIREQDYVTCQAQMIPGDPWPEVCTRFLPDGMTPPEVVPGPPVAPEAEAVTP